MKLSSTKGLHAVLEQPIVDLVHVRPVVDRLALRVLIVDAEFIMEDGVKAHVLEAGDRFHLAQVAR